MARRPKRKKRTACRVRFEQDGRFGWSAVLYDSRGRSINVIHGYKRKPTANQRHRARRLLCGPRRKRK